MSKSKNDRKLRKVIRLVEFPSEYARYELLETSEEIRNVLFICYAKNIWLIDIFLRKKHFDNARKYVKVILSRVKYLGC